MKKILAFCTALMCCLCLSAACGKNKESSGTTADTGNSSQINDSANEDQTAAPLEEVPGEEFVEVYRKFFLSENPDEAVDSTLPSVITDMLKKINAFDYVSSGMKATIAQTIAGSSADEYPMAEYISQRACDPELKNDLERLYSAYYQLFAEISEYNIDYAAFLDGTIDDSTMNKIQESNARFISIAQGEEELSEVSVKIEDARFVTMSVDDSQVEMLFYKVNGEGWRLDSMGAAAFEY